MSGQTCALEGCSKACTSAQHLACGELHHLLLMAGRYSSAHPHPHQSILERNGRGLCALLSCSKPPWPGHPWCSRSHYLSWLSAFYASLSPLQICKLQGCTRHVYVFDTDGTPPSEFCGWRHCQKFAALNGLQQQPPSEPLSNEKNCDLVPCMKSVMHELKHFALYGVTPKSVRVDCEFFTKHPWEVLAEGNSCDLIVPCNFTGRSKGGKQRDMVTKDHYHWKQQGSPKVENGYCKRYLSYQKRQETKDNAFQHQDESAYTMKEYVMNGVDLYSFVKICRSVRKARKGGKRRKGGSGFGGCSQGSVTSKVDSSLDYQQFIENFEELFPEEGFFEEQRPCSSVVLM